MSQDDKDLRKQLMDGMRRYVMMQALRHDPNTASAAKIAAMLQRRLDNNWAPRKTVAEWFMEHPASTFEGPRRLP